MPTPKYFYFVHRIPLICHLCLQEYTVPPSSDEEPPASAPKYAKGPAVPSVVAPSSVSNWSLAGPLAPSAKEMWQNELLQNKIEEARLKEREKAEALAQECARLRAELVAAKKRPRPTTCVQIYV